MLSRRQQSGRRTGIDILGDVPWGTHLCLFYETEKDLIDILVPYFKAGLENNEFCMWVTSEPLNEKKARDALSTAIPDFDRYVEANQIEIIPHNQWYLKNGVFNMQRVLNDWVYKVNQALDRGFEGVRATGSRGGFEKGVWKEFADYEKQVNEAIGKYRMIAICSYCIDECGASEIIDVVNSHQSSLIRQEGKWQLVESTEHKKAEEVLERTAHNLGEQAKELNCLYGLSKIVEEPNISLEGIFRRMMDMLPPAWQYPDITCARIVFEDREFKTDNFTLTEWKQSADIVVEGKKTGALEVYYLEKRPEIDEGPFSSEERELIEGIAERLGRIAERKKAKQALQVSENKHKTLLENLPQKIFLKDKNSVYVSCNENYAKDLKIKAEEIVGKTDYDFYPRELAEKYRADDRRIMKSGKTEDINEKYIRNGRELVVHIVKTPVRDEKGNVARVLGIFWDITAQRQAQRKLLAYQKRLRDLTSEMSLTEERERKRLAIELHDHVTQNLILFKINLGELLDKSSPGELVEPMDEIYKHLDRIIGDMRSLIFDLGSPTLYELGLEAAVREYLNEEIQQKHGIMTEFEDDAQAKSLDGDVCAILYRAVRELLINVVKHAHAQCVKVSICKSNDNIRINVIDDGVGFKPPAEGFGLGKTTGFGLFSIRERLSYLGGSVEIESKPGEGTRITLVAPIKYGRNVEKLIR